MPSPEDWTHLVEVVKSTGDEKAISTLTSLTITVYVNTPKKENSPKEDASVEVKNENSGVDTSPVQPKAENSPKEEAPVEEAPVAAKEENSEAVIDKMDEVYSKILANAEASGDPAKVASVKRAYEGTLESENEKAAKLLKISETDPVMAAMMARIDKETEALRARFSPEGST